MLFLCVTFNSFSSLKYWRLRMILMPLAPFTAINKEILDPQVVHCDVYNKVPDKIDHMEGFHRFLDSCINKVRRKTPTQAEKPGRIIITKDTPLSEICQLMKSTETGLPFLAKTNGFCDDTFLSFDAVQWICKHAPEMTVSEAKSMCHTMLSKNLIVHASGNRRY